MSVLELKGLKASLEIFRKAKEDTWAHLMKTDAVTSKIRTTIEGGMILRVGRGNFILFWHDKWCDLGPLKGAFPRLFSTSTQKNMFIAQMGSWHEGSWAWNLRWRRGLYDWELEDIARLAQIIQHKQPTNDSDALIWRGSGNSSFHVKSISDKIYKSSSPLIPKQSVASIWQSHTPPRAQLTVWLAHLEKLKTSDILWEKGISNPSRHFAPFAVLMLKPIPTYCSPVHSLGVSGWKY